jgi:hypothetical protein
MNDDRKKIFKQTILNDLRDCLNSSESENIVYRGENKYLLGLISLLKPGINCSKREFLAWYAELLKIENTPLLSIETLLRLTSTFKYNRNFLNQLEIFSRSNKHKVLPDEVWTVFMTTLMLESEGTFIDAKIYIVNKVVNDHWEALKKCNVRALFRFILSSYTSLLLKANGTKETDLKNTRKKEVQNQINQHWGFFFYWINKMVLHNEDLSINIDRMVSKGINNNRQSKFTPEKEVFLNFIEPKLPPFFLAHNYSLACISELSVHFHAQKALFEKSEIEFIKVSQSLYLLRPLLGNFVLPEIFYNRFHRSDWTEEISRFMLHALKGKPLHQFEELPFKLTQKACHKLLTVPEFTRLSFWTNLAAAQLLSLNVSLEFTTAAIMLIDRFRSRYDFWIQVFEILYNKGATHNELVNLSDYIRYVHFDLEEPIDLKNISLNNLRTRSLEWHVNLNVKRTKNQKLPRLDVKLFKYTDPDSDINYCIRQLTTSWELYAEGTLMHHCVYTYTNSCLAKNAFIFSLRQIEDEHELPMVTIQVNKLKQIVQTKGAYNRTTTAFEDGIIRMWEERNLISKDSQ